jgi:hypothetical protein
MGRTHLFESGMGNSCGSGFGYGAGAGSGRHGAIDIIGSYNGHIGINPLYITYIKRGLYRTLTHDGDGIGRGHGMGLLSNASTGVSMIDDYSTGDHKLGLELIELKMEKFHD